MRIGSLCRWYVSVVGTIHAPYSPPLVRSMLSVLTTFTRLTLKDYYWGGYSIGTLVMLLHPPNHIKSEIHQRFIREGKFDLTINDLITCHSHCMELLVMIRPNPYLLDLSAIHSLSRELSIRGNVLIISWGSELPCSPNFASHVYSLDLWLVCGRAGLWPEVAR